MVFSAAAPTDTPARSAVLKTALATPDSRCAAPRVARFAGPGDSDSPAPVRSTAGQYVTGGAVARVRGMVPNPASANGAAGARAAVLGPGGVVGTAWLIGLAEGLRRAGADLAGADLIVGTSAGAIAAALAAGGRDLTALAGISPGAALVTDPTTVTDQAFAVMREAGQDPVGARQRAGRLARTATTSPQAARIDRMRALVGTEHWPHPGLVIPTVNAESGQPRIWAADDNIPVYLAVTASTAFPGQSAPITITNRYYLDGALRNGSNADLAADAKVLLIAEPLGHIFPTVVPAGPSRVVQITADAGSIGTFGPDLADETRWTASFGAGLRQAATAANDARTAWLA